ncbi:sigma-70 family RNA polymerase sigma factor [bacterium]|nr:sigma-70 family RNA polymerase sigma factor [bacterium]
MQDIQTWGLTVFARLGREERDIAFERIWKKYHKRILFFIRNRAPLEAEDLLQEVMLKVYQNLHRYNPARSFQAWIYAIARNHCINHLTQKKVLVARSAGRDGGEDLFVETETPEDRMIRSEQDRKIRTVLLTLDAEHRETAYLRYYEGMKCSRIAEVTAVPVGTVKSRLFFIRERLRYELEEKHENRRHTQKIL